MPQNVRYAPATRSWIAAGAVRQMLRRCDFAVKPTNRERANDAVPLSRQSPRWARCRRHYIYGRPSPSLHHRLQTDRPWPAGREHSRVPRVVDHPPLVDDTMRWAGC